MDILVTLFVLPTNFWFLLMEIACLWTLDKQEIEDILIKRAVMFVLVCRLTPVSFKIVVVHVEIVTDTR